MANSKVIKRSVSVEQRAGVTLTLSNEEAYALRTLLSNVGGDSSTTPRGYADDIGIALDAAGYYSFGKTFIAQETHVGGVYFAKASRQQFDERVEELTVRV